MKPYILLGAAILQIGLVKPQMVERPPEVNYVEEKQFEKKEPLAKLELPSKRNLTVSKPSNVSSDVEHIKATITRYAVKYGVSAERLLRVAQCESTFNPRAVNYNYSVKGTHPSGLFQHVALYWPDRAARYGRTGASIFDYDAQADVTAQMFRDGGAGAWECK